MFSSVFKTENMTNKKKESAVFKKLYTILKEPGPSNLVETEQN